MSPERVGMTACVPLQSEGLRSHRVALISGPLAKAHVPFPTVSKCLLNAPIPEAGAKFRFLQ